jgi:outer membrane protein assembly factor BamB
VLCASERRSAIQAHGGGIEHAIADDGTTFARAWDVLLAIEASGSVRWERGLHPNLAFDVAIDARGDLLLSSGGFFRIDAATGADLWEVEGTRTIPGGFSFPNTATIDRETFSDDAVAVDANACSSSPCVLLLFVCRFSRRLAPGR